MRPRLKKPIARDTRLTGDATRCSGFRDRGRGQSNGREREQEMGSGENKYELMKTNLIQPTLSHGQVLARHWGYKDDSVPSLRALRIQGLCAPRDTSSSTD